jgi:hypothetical protein
MEMILCPNCNKLTGYKRVLGFGTFFAVLLTAGLWLLAIPFYPKRCITCGLTKSESVPWYRTWRIAALLLLLSVGIVGLIETNARSSNGSDVTPTPENPSVQQEVISSAIAKRDGSEDIELREDGRVYSVALIVSTHEIPIGEKLFAQGRLESFDYPSGTPSRPFAIIQDEQQPGNTLLCAMTEEEGGEVVSLYHAGEVVAVSGEYMGSAGLGRYPAMPILRNCHVARPQNSVVRPPQPINEEKNKIDEGTGSSRSAFSADPQQSDHFQMVVDNTPDCFHVADDEVLCDARLFMRLGDRRRADFYVACDTASATCTKLVSGETYVVEFVSDRTKYAGCSARQSEYINAAYRKVAECIKIQATPHDLIYSLIRQGEEND